MRLTNFRIENGQRQPKFLTLIRRKYFQNKAGIIGLGIFFIVLMATLLGPLFYPANPFETVGKRWPGGAFPLGTDYWGRDVLAGIVRGAKTSFFVGIMAAAVMMTIGILLGALSGYYGGLTDDILMRVTEIFQVLPSLILAMVVVVLIKPSLWTIILAISVSAWPGIARIVRTEFLSLRERDFVTASKTLGATNARIIWREIFPNALPPIIVNASLAVGIAILFEAGLSFLGLGDPNVMSWGYMIGASRTYIRQAWWSVTFPGVAIFTTVLSLNLIGDWLNDLLNPKIRGRRQG